MGPLLLGVSSSDPAWQFTTDVGQVPVPLLREITHFLHAHLALGGSDHLDGRGSGWQWAGVDIAVGLLPGSSSGTT